MPQINSEIEYEDLFSSKNGGQNNWRKDALAYALEIRKFEIDLYWKRATYFWTLIAAAFAGYFALHNVVFSKRDHASIFIITCIGLVLSLAWYLVNRGSKYWQENWERHVDVLSEKVVGPLYRTTLSYDYWPSIIKPHVGFPFSVSRVNQIVSLFITIIWFGLAIHAFPFFQFKPLSRETAYWLMAAVTLIFLFMMVWLGWPQKRQQPRKIFFDVAEFDEIINDKAKTTTETTSTTPN